jgi:hypothetical protein
MHRVWRPVCAAANPVSTAVTRWWCLSALRHLLTGEGLTGQQRQLIRRQRRPPAGTSPAEGNKVRAEMLDELLGRDDHRV